MVELSHSSWLMFLYLPCVISPGRKSFLKIIVLVYYLENIKPKTHHHRHHHLKCLRSQNCCHSSQMQRCPALDWWWWSKLNHPSPMSQPWLWTFHAHPYHSSSVRLKFRPKVLQKRRKWRLLKLLSENFELWRRGFLLLIFFIGDFFYIQLLDGNLKEGKKI